MHSRYSPLLGFLLLISPVAMLVAAPTAGKVVDLNGQAIPYSSVIVRETLEAAQTDKDGDFTIDLPESGKFTLAVVAPGKGPVDFPMEPPLKVPLTVRLTQVTGQAVGLEEVTVMAGDYPTGTVPGAAVTAVEVLTTPGAMGDVNRALQTLPGVQNVDEGNGLYVRGGEYWETGALINGSLFPSAVRLEASTSTFVGTVNPFLTRSISFKSGGFGAGYGNLLSGVVALETESKPSSLEATLNVGLGAVSFGGAVPLGKNFGLRATATHFDLRSMMDVNGSPRTFRPPPRGNDLSGSAIWEYRPGAELKAFVIQQSQKLGVDLEDPSYTGLYTQERRSVFGVLSINDHVGQAAVSGSLSTGVSRSLDLVGGLNAEMRQPSTRGSVKVAYPFSDALGIEAGAEFEHANEKLVGSKPASSDATAPGSDVISVTSQISGTRSGFFAEGDWTPVQHLRVVAGGRIDDSTLTGETTFDPRLSAAYALSKGIQLTAAGGVYHQVPDLLFYNPTISAGKLPAMRATHEIVGVKFGTGSRQLRIEAYRKDYANLVQFTRANTIAHGGVGRAQGLDIFGRSPLPLGLTGRMTVSLLDATRTDPDTGVLSRSSVGIRQSTTVILERAFGPRFKAGLSWRSATGRPVTEVVGAAYDSATNTYTPTYGTPFGAELRPYQRVDFSITGVTSRSKHLLTAWYISVSDLFGRANPSDITYSSDYTQRRVIPNTFNRALYVGVSLIYR